MLPPSHEFSWPLPVTSITVEGVYVRLGFVSAQSLNSHSSNFLAYITIPLVSGAGLLTHWMCSDCASAPDESYFRMLGLQRDLERESKPLSPGSLHANRVKRQPTVSQGTVVSHCLRGLCPKTLPGHLKLSSAKLPLYCVFFPYTHIKDKVYLIKYIQPGMNHNKYKIKQS